MTDDETYIDYEDLPDIQTDTLIELPHVELESYLRESRSILDVTDGPKVRHFVRFENAV